jgi:hypothetical protein
MRRAGLALLSALLTGCAVAHVQLPDGGGVQAIVVGHSRVTCCAPGSMDSAAGAFAGTCVQVEGGALSSSFVEALSLVGSALVALATHGALW